MSLMLDVMWPADILDIEGTLRALCRKVGPLTNEDDSQNNVSVLGRFLIAPLDGPKGGEFLGQQNIQEPQPCFVSHHRSS